MVLLHLNNVCSGWLYIYLNLKSFFRNKNVLVIKTNIWEKNKNKLQCSKEMGRHMAQELHTEDERLSEVKPYSHRTVSYKSQWDNTTHTGTANLRRTDYTQCCWDCRARGCPTLPVDSTVVTRGSCVFTTTQKCTVSTAALTRDSSKPDAIQTPTAGRGTGTTVWEYSEVPPHDENEHLCYITTGITP